MAGAAAGMPKVVQVLDVINSDVDELDLRFGITEDGDIVVVVRDFVQCARGVSKKSANQALAGKASENLARKALEADVKKLRAQLRAAHEVQRVPEEVSRFLATTAEVQLVEEDETMTWRAQIRTDSGRTQSLHADTLSSRTRGADAPARDEGAPAKRPREGDSAAEVDARRSFVALCAPWY